jgi:trehalose-6-phosphate synthase
MDAQGDEDAIVLAQLNMLHKELATLRSRGETSTAAASPSQAGGRQAHAKGKLIVCALRRPVKITMDASGGVTFAASGGGFKRAIDGLKSDCEVRWVSWPGEVYGAAAQDTVRDRLEAESNTTAVFLTRDLADLYYRQVIIIFFDEHV